MSKYTNELIERLSETSISQYEKVENINIITALKNTLSSKVLAGVAKFRENNSINIDSPVEDLYEKLLERKFCELVTPETRDRYYDLKDSIKKLEKKINSIDWQVNEHRLNYYGDYYVNEGETMTGSYVALHRWYGQKWSVAMDTYYNDSAKKTMQKFIEENKEVLDLLADAYIEKEDLLTNSYVVGNKNDERTIDLITYHLGYTCKSIEQELINDRVYMEEQKEAKAI